MRDQADELRSIVLKSARPWTAATGPAPRLVALAGGKGGVGTTTLSLNLAVALAQQGQRVILIDADLERADIATLCHMKERYSIADVLSARRDIHEVLEPGPAGIQVLPGSWGEAQSAHCSPFILERFVQSLKSLGPHAEILVADLGSRIGQIESQLWRAADEVLLVTTPDTVSVMDAYATIKTVVSGHALFPPIRTIVNQSVDEKASAEVQRRIVYSCQRFLGLTPVTGGIVRIDGKLADAAQHGTPLILQCPTCPAARDIEAVAAAIAAVPSMLPGGAVRAAG